MNACLEKKTSEKERFYAYLNSQMSPMKIKIYFFLLLAALVLNQCHSTGSRHPTEEKNNILGPELLNAYIESDKPVLVDFNATWCAPCRTMHPLLAEVSNTYASSLTVVSVDVDEYPDWADKYKVRSLPTFMIFKKGKTILTHEGSTSKEDFIAKIETALQAAQ